MPMDNTGGLNTSCASASHVSQPNFYGYSTPSLVLSEFSQPHNPPFKNIQFWTHTYDEHLVQFLKAFILLL